MNLKLVNETVKWANSLSEMWTGTTISRIIDVQKERLKTALESNDERANMYLLDLAQTCDRVEELEFE